MPKTRKDSVSLYLEVPPSLKDRLAEVAKTNNRSSNGEANVALERHVASEEAAQRAAKKAAKGGAS
jgi:predicted transcriptional regulator